MFDIAEKEPAAAQDPFSDAAAWPNKPEAENPFGNMPYNVVNNPNELSAELIKSVAGDKPPFFRTRMLDTIDAVEEYSWTRGEMGGLDWGFDSLNKAFEGLNTGVHLVGGQSNIGKSSFMMQLAWQVAQANRIPSKERPRKAFVLYFSLDDNNNELLPRFVAIDQRIPINVVRFPKKYQDNATYMEKRSIGVERLKDSADFINIVDVNNGSDIEYIEKTMEEYHVELQKVDPAYQLVVFIDNFHDITIGDEKLRAKTGGEKYDHIADSLTKIATRYDCPIVCTAEFRKLNGNRRPTVEDLRDSVKILYEAKAVMLCYNEVSLRGQQATVNWMRSDNPNKQAVYEVQIGKNKFSSFKGRCFFEFIPEMAYFREVPEAGAQRYAQMISG
ncbi:DnaB-like helicase C-terminal domain-containing protein [Cytobacillus oceanisediminis]|uniref:DnaB-like helicase C-terminal domain-containing protein n=1 Tax=Cytobacillus oceanisediminis TaxID=665099 RepID=UPI001FB53CA8|nr:DnaB-like helicase C-terminal domain-containing protein [Cytobacillus oceanisediminis]UOE58219.1 AAA family ATPase [Cytobacillus oceanisediminis]